MPEPGETPEGTSFDFNEAVPTLAYAKRAPWWRREYTPEQERRQLLAFTGVVFVLTLLYWAGLFWRCRPALDLFCLGPFVPWILTIAWAVTGWNLLTFTRRYPPPYRRRLLYAISVGALFMAPYSLIRADNDMFALGVRYRIWRAGGAAKVQAEFGQWLSSREYYDPGTKRKMLFRDVAPGGNLVPVPPAQLPVSVRYLRQHMNPRFGISLDEVAHIDMVAFPNTADLFVGPPDWELEGETGWWDHLCGGRRKIADGIWIVVGFYDK